MAERALLEEDPEPASGTGEEYVETEVIDQDISTRENSSPRCRRCHRALFSERASLCVDSWSCAKVRESWQWNPCPAARCEFTAVEHKAITVGNASVRWTCPDGWESVRAR